MKNILTAIGQQTRAFQRHWLSYFSLFVSVDLVIQLIVIPLFRLATTVILQAAQIPFISYQNVVIIARHHPLVVVALLVELICLLLVVDLQFAAVLLGIRDISREMFTVRGLVREIWETLRRLRPSSLLVLMVYFILVIPFADLVYRTPLLAKIQVPQFILDYLTRNGLLLTATVMIYIVLTFLGLRLVWALPLMVYQRLRPRAAFRQSWQRTQGRRWLAVALRLLAIGFLAVLVMAAFYALVIGAQWLLDFLPQPVAALFANINLLIIQLGSELVTTWTGVVTVSLLAVNYGCASDGLATAGCEEQTGLCWPDPGRFGGRSGCRERPLPLDKPAPPAGDDFPPRGGGRKWGAKHSPGVETDPPPAPGLRGVRCSRD